MKLKIADSIIALLFLFAAIESMLTNLTGYYYLSLGFALFYFVVAFSVLRTYSWAAYLLYINAVTLLLIAGLGLYMTNGKAWPIAVVPLLFATISALYGWFRYRGAKIERPFWKELRLFVFALFVFIALVVSVDYFWRGATTLSVPVIIQ